MSQTSGQPSPPRWTAPTWSRLAPRWRGAWSPSRSVAECRFATAVGGSRPAGKTAATCSSPRTASTAPRRRLRPRRPPPPEVADSRDRGRSSLRRHGEVAARVPGQERSHHRQTQLRHSSSPTAWSPGRDRSFWSPPGPCRLRCSPPQPCACATSSRWRTPRGAEATFALDAAVEWIERTESGGFLLQAVGTTRPGPITLEADAAIAATGFRTPIQDLRELGLATVSDGRIPALSRTGRARRCRASTSPGTRCKAPPASGRTV